MYKLIKCFLGCFMLVIFAAADDEIEFLRHDDEDDDNYHEGSLYCGDEEIGGGWSYSRLQGSCNQYLQCTEHDKAYIQTCAAGTFYDGHECRHAHKVICPYDVCQVKPDGFVYPDGQSCYGFYKCIAGKSTYMKCHNGFYFNPYKSGCFHDPTCQKDSIIHPCNFGTTSPFPGRPNLFYLYNGFETYTPMQCPKGTWYRPDICTCDWIIPGKTGHGGCQPMYHFAYDGNFLEMYNRVQQVPTSGVALFRKAALFDQGGKIVIWAMNNLDLDSDFAMCFEFMSKTMNGEIALISNDYSDEHFTYRLSYTPSNGVVKAYFILKDGGIAQLTVVGVDPLRPHFLRLARFGQTMKLRIDNLTPAVIKIYNGISRSKSPMVIGAAKGCNNYVGYFDELKYFRCVPEHFFGDYDDDDDNDKK